MNRCLSLCNKVVWFYRIYVVYEALLNLPTYKKNLGFPVVSVYNPSQNRLLVFG